VPSPDWPRPPDAQRQESASTMTKIQESGDRVIANVERVIVGKHQEVQLALVALLCRGHLLIEDVPGTGKTVAGESDREEPRLVVPEDPVHARLLPSDVTGLSIYNQKTQEFEFRPGPIHEPVVLADEINRATPKTQSALLECMEERQATIDGISHQMPDPFLVIATRTPSSTRGRSRSRRPSSTVHAPAPAGLPDPTEEIVILDEQKRIHPLDDLEEVCPVAELREMQAAVRETYVDASVAEYIVRLVNATRNHPDIYLGASPRGSIALYRAGQARAALLGRDYVIPDDVKTLAGPALAHRVIIKTSSSIREVDAETVVRELLDSVPVDAPARPGGPRRIEAEARAAAELRAGPIARALPAPPSPPRRRRNAAGGRLQHRLRVPVLSRLPRRVGRRGELPGHPQRAGRPRGRLLREPAPGARG